ncbi:Gfo/Idh/MocA family protein [Kocuria sp. M1R5S2]|uniref:Gfo/Idh/MocA family protein n=1 Tax=Kocuria rhizosphaerae TaxID=3376285 RepID=UPI003797FA11
MNPMKVLVLGMGRWGNRWLEALEDIPGVALAGTAGGTVRVAADRLPRTGSYCHYRSFTEALDRCPADAVIITLPVRLHTEAITRALESGMHVLVEKPLVGTRQDLAAVLAARSQRPDMQVVVSQNYRYRPWARRARQQISSGILGDVRHISIRFSKAEILEGGRDKLQAPLLEDMFIHHLDLVRYLTGSEAVEVFAIQHRPPWSRYPGMPGLEALITLADGTVVNYSGTWAGRGPETSWDGEFVFHGEQGVLEVAEDKVALNGDPTAALVPQRIPNETNDLRVVFQSFRQAVDGDEIPETDVSDNRRTVELLFAVEESLKSHRPVPVRA